MPNVVPSSLQSIVFNSLVNSIEENNYHLTTGIIGVRYMFPVLSLFNRTDLALTVATQTSYPSFGYMMNNPFENATTLWEVWDAFNEGD